MHDIVRAIAENISHLSPQGMSDGDSRERAVAIDGHAVPDTNHIGRVASAREVRRDDVHVMPAKACFAREEMDVLADSTEVRIVVLRDLGDSKSVHGVEARTAAARGRIDAPVPNPRS